METLTINSLLVRPFRLESLFLHFFDIHFLDEKGAVSSTEAFKEEIRIATRIAIAASERVYIPAASYFESPLCRSVVNELFNLGTISMTGSSPNLEIFIDEHRESAFYQRGSHQHQVYTLARPDGGLPPYFSRTRSATNDIVNHWNSLLVNDELQARLSRHCILQPQVAQRLELVPSILGSKAFVPEHVFKILDLGPENQIVRNRLKSTINEAYFGSFTQDLNSGVIENLSYLSTPYAIPSFSTCISYSKIVRSLRQQNRLHELLTCSPLRLLQLAEDRVWQQALLGSLLHPSETGSRLQVNSRELLVSKDDQPGKGKSSDIYIINKMEVIMRDQYKTGQAGAVGPRSHAHDINFNQVWNEVGSSIKLDQLAEDLARLRSVLKSEANSAEHDHAIGQVASAEIAARKGDGPTALQHMLNAGKWAFDVGTKIGTGVAIAAMKSGLGF